MTRGFDLEFGGALGLVTDLYLRPAFRRRGLGAKAIRHLSKVCAAEGLGSIELQVEKKNKKARAFYRAMGFVPHDRVPMSKRLPG
jgi:ribosomal protein S18 acetylase RimI-like enzyme